MHVSWLEHKSYKKEEEEVRSYEDIEKNRNKKQKNQGKRKKKKAGSMDGGDITTKVYV